MKNGELLGTGDNGNQNFFEIFSNYINKLDIKDIANYL